MLKKLTKRFTEKERGLDDFVDDIVKKYEDKERKDGKVNLISDKLNKHSSSGNTQRDKPKREREDRGPSL
ncbi:hypothetical protein [Enterococcus sp.]|uniref:hypothetical protein n=1 Tax=Enterococcus sp. TaxID=35783 RepID=UPI002586931D|nr:hypothetical protein [Enterococcus sp.]